MIDRLFALSLILNMTGLFRFLAPQMGVSIGMISIALLALNLFYIFVNLPLSQRLLLHGGMGGLMFILVVWPLLALPFGTVLRLREIGLLLFFFSLVFGAGLYAVKNGLHAIHRVMLVSLLISLVGMGLSMTMPGYFASVAEAAQAHIQSEGAGRAFGFFLQPNSMAVGMVILFIAWFACWEGKKSVLEVVAIMVLLVVILLSGSRTGMVLSALLVLFTLAFSWKSYLRDARVLLKLVTLGILVLVSAVGLRVYLSNQDTPLSSRQADLIQRMEMLLNLKLTNEDSILEDESVTERMHAQKNYLDLIAQRPLTGYGVGANSQFLEDETLDLLAHSDFLMRALEYGVLYPVVFMLVMLRLYFRRRRREIEHALGVNAITQFVFLLLFAYVINGIIMDSRVFYVVLGVFATVVYNPQYFFAFDPVTGKIIGRKGARREERRVARSSEDGQDAHADALEAGISPEEGVRS